MYKIRSSHKIIWGFILLLLFFGNENGYSQDKNIFNIQEELTIGVSEGKPEYMFSRISSIAVDDQERVFVLDYLEADLTVFNQNGEHIQTIGRRGQGPGEFASPFSLGLTKQNTIMIHDLNNRRINFFSHEGKYISSISTADMIMTKSNVDSEGNIIGLVFSGSPKNQIIELIKFDSKKNTLVTYQKVTRTASESLNNPFQPELVWNMYKKEGVICGYSKTYELNVVDDEGQILFTIQHAYKPVKITQQEIDNMTKKLPAAIEIKTPQYHSAFHSITADEKGRIFVGTWARPESGNGFIYDVFDPDGAFITSIALEYPPQIWKNSKLYSIEENKEGYPVVKRYSVHWK